MLKPAQVTTPPHKAGSNCTLTFSSERIEQLLSTGLLMPVFQAAGNIGIPISPRAGDRWSLNGRFGLRLPTRRGRYRSRITTVACLRAWLAAVNDLEEMARAARVQPALDQEAADCVLAAHGIGRNSNRG
jgi:hypothetical protein